MSVSVGDSDTGGIGGESRPALSDGPDDDDEGNGNGEEEEEKKRVVEDADERAGEDLARALTLDEDPRSATSSADRARRMGLLSGPPPPLPPAPALRALAVPPRSFLGLHSLSRLGAGREGGVRHWVAGADRFAPILAAKVVAGSACPGGGGSAMRSAKVLWVVPGRRSAQGDE